MVFHIFRRKSRQSLLADRESYRRTSTPDLSIYHQYQDCTAPPGQPPSLTYATLKKIRRKSHVDTLSRGFLKNSSKHSKSVASLLCETSDGADMEDIGGNKGLESMRSNYVGAKSNPAHASLAMIDVESGYSSIENNALNLTGENCPISNSNETNGMKVSSEVTDIIVDIIRKKIKMKSHFYSEILEQTVSFHLPMDSSSNQAEMMINNEQFVAKNTEKVIYELRNEILDKVATLREERKVLENVSLRIQDQLQSQKYIFKLVSFCNDLDIFVNLSVKVELKLNNLTSEESRSFVKLKLENQKENLKEIKVWMNQRQYLLEDLVEESAKLNIQESLHQIIEKKILLNTELCLALEHIKNLDNILMILNYL